MAVRRSLGLALWALWPCGLALDATWSVVDTHGTASSGRPLVELCAWEQLHLRVDAVVDTATFHWLDQLPSSGDSTVHALVGVVRVDQGDRVVAKQRVEFAVWPDDDDRENELRSEPSHAAIECAFDAAFCVPKIVGIRLPDVVGDSATLGLNHSIIVQFADATNQPEASTREAIDAFVAFPVYVGDALEGRWTDDKTLVITVVALDETRVLPLQPLMESLVHTTLRGPERAPWHETGRRVRLHGSVRLRLEPEGQYVVRLLDGDSIAGWDSPVVRVRRCDTPEAEASPLIVVLEDETSSSISTQRAHDQDKETAFPEPTVFIDGVLSHSGEESFVLRHSTFQMEEPGSWSLNFWLFTDQDSSGGFRSLFFNGDGTGQHRTPSAWFHPDNRRLVLRVSTIEDMDVGLDSVGEIPLNEWVNIGVTLKNCSTGIDANSTARAECKPTTNEAKPWLYSMKLFVNGKIDQVVRIFSPVLPNDGPLHVGDGPWTDGVRGFTSQLRVYNRSILDSDHTAIYRHGRRTYRSLKTIGLCEDASGLSGVTQLHPHPAQQIAYWGQCLTLQSPSEHDSLTSSTISKDGTASSIYDEYVRLLSSCDHSAWDFLNEAADLGDPRALRDLGTALTYGSLAFTEGGCAKTKIDGVLVDLDHAGAKQKLLEALSQKEWGAARALALLNTHNRERNDRFQTGLYHWAAASGRKDAFMVLGRVYTIGHHGVRADTEIAAYHYYYAARNASETYHARGKQPLHEMNRLYDGIDKEDELRQGQLGDDDELIQYQKMRADKDGDVEAMANMGDLYYWGARGLARDHDQAYHYFRRAAEQGHTSAQSAVAGMLLKGEGVKQDNTSAVEWYEKAALKNHTRALNGLGFIYFHGSGGMSENKTRALEFFERAAANLEDGDSVFNAGYCHAHALGTSRNITRAAQYYDSAARKFGHFDAIYELGKLYWTGWDDHSEASDSSVPRDSSKATTYLKAASEAGTWGASVRTGFEYFLARQYERAAIVYAEATEYGYGVATSNLAYLYDQKLLQIGDTASEERALEQLHRARERNGDKEVLVRIGDFHYYGMGGLPSNPAKALEWYSRASAQGIEAGAYNVGHMHEYGLRVRINYDRAERYYRRVLELSPPSALDKQIVIHLALLRLRMRRYLDGSPIGKLVFAPVRTTSLADDIASLPSLPGRVDDREGENWHYVTQAASVAAALVVISLGTWLLRRRHLTSI